MKTEGTVAIWTFEPGHTAAEFRARHMMVTYVRGAFKNVHGTLTFDPGNPRLSSVEATIDASAIWTGEPQRDAHLRSADFLDVEHHPQITYRGAHVELIGDHDYLVTGALTIRGVTRSVSLRVIYLGQWQTPWWEQQAGEWIDKGPRLRAGFVATTEINRQDFGVRWNDTMDKGGVVVGDTVSITIDAEAVWEKD
jgi:polyisoprenoid-binding protein YceI